MQAKISHTGTVPQRFWVTGVFYCLALLFSVTLWLCVSTKGLAGVHAACAGSGNAYLSWSPAGKVSHGGAFETCKPRSHTEARSHRCFGLRVFLLSRFAFLCDFVAVCEHGRLSGGYMPQRDFRRSIFQLGVPVVTDRYKPPTLSILLHFQ